MPGQEWSVAVKPPLPTCHGKSPHLGRSSPKCLSSRRLCNLGFRAPLSSVTDRVYICSVEMRTCPASSPGHYEGQTRWCINEKRWYRGAMQMCDWLIQPGKLHWKKRAFTREGHLQVSTPHAHEGCLVEDWVSSSELTYEICQVSVSLKKKKSRCSHETQARWKIWCPDNVKGF